MKFINTTDSIEILETERHVIVYAALLLISALVVVLFGWSLQTFALIAVGLFFGVAGVLLAWIAEIKTTVLRNDGSITITYDRIIGHKKWVRILDRSDVRKIDYARGRNVGSGWIINTIYLDTSFDQQISIGSQLRGDIDKEVGEMAAYLQVPINTISMLDVKSTVRSPYVPKDSMGPVLQRPSQEQLEQERSRG